MILPPAVVVKDDSELVPTPPPVADGGPGLPDPGPGLPDPGPGLLDGEPGLLGPGLPDPGLVGTGLGHFLPIPMKPQNHLK